MKIDLFYTFKIITIISGLLFILSGLYLIESDYRELRMNRKIITILFLIFTFLFMTGIVILNIKIFG